MWNALCMFLFVRTVWAEFNFTYNMAHRCKEHISSNGYHYSPFYRVSDVTPLEPGTVFEMHIAILAASNGHVLLSPIESPGLSDPVYEIVLGGGANKFSEIRRMQKRRTKISEVTIGLLSPIHFRAFWIRITDDGSVDVGREGESIPFLHYSDPDPISISYFSFASWTNVEAKFLYDCPTTEDEASENITKSEVVAPKLTTAQRLKVSLLGDRSPLTPPATRVTVRIALSIAGIRYDGSVLTTLVAVTLTWKDDLMVWNPDDYNGTTILLLRQSEIWKPEFYVHNSVGIGELSPAVTEPVYILNSGQAALHLRTEVSTWCEDRKGAFSWPRDEYKCPLYIGPWEMYEHIHMEVGSPEKGETTFENAYMVNEWEPMGSAYDLKSSALSPYANMTCSGGEYSQTNTLLVLEMRIRRNGAYSMVLYTPLLTVMIFILMSFWWVPLTHAQNRVHLYSVTSVLLIALLSYFDGLTLGHTVPSIMILYQLVLLTTQLALMTQLILMNERFGERYLGWLQRAVSSPILSFVCCLPSVKTYAAFTSEADEEALETSSSSPCTSNLEALETEAPPARPTPHQALAAATDRVMFSLYLVLYAVMLACHY